MCVSKDNSERLSMRIKQCHHIISFESHTDTTNSSTYLGTCNGRAGHSAESSCAHHFDKSVEVCVKKTEQEYVLCSIGMSGTNTNKSTKTPYQFFFSY